MFSFNAVFDFSFLQVLDIVIKIFQQGGSEELDIPLDPSNFHLDPKLLE